MSKKSDSQKIRRHIMTRIKKGRCGKPSVTYADNRGVEYTTKRQAKIHSFCNIIFGCLKNGFPIAVPKLWYGAWAFYPFFFIRKNLAVKDPISVLNHERIHVRQQFDIHVTISLPIVILCCFAECFGGFNPIYLLCIIPFIPTLLYGVEMLRSLFNLLRTSSTITFSKVRVNTCFEREAISRGPDIEYLSRRKFWAVLAYTGVKKFQNYGV